MGTLYLAVQMWTRRLDIAVNYSAVLGMPVELRLELMPVVGLDVFDAKRELSDHVVRKIDRTRLSVGRIHFQCKNSGRIVDRRVWIPLNSAARLFSDKQEFDIN